MTVDVKMKIMMRAIMVKWQFDAVPVLGSPYGSKANTGSSIVVKLNLNK
jgi:hypothetical protein